MPRGVTPGVIEEELITDRIKVPRSPTNCR